jgi:uncharacterized protein (DUF58 family)
MDNIKSKNKINPKLLIKTKRGLFLNSSGEHSSIFNGDGLDFKEIRQYDSGDDIRHVNWKVTARSGMPSVNIFNEDKQLNIVLVYLNSGSIYFGSNRSKQDTMVETMTILGNTALQKNDILSTLFFAKDQQAFIKPIKKQKIVNSNIDLAYELNPLGNNIDYKKLEFVLMNKIRQKSLIFLIGDFLDIPDFKVLSKKHEVFCVVVRDRLEEDLKLTGEFNFVDTASMDNETIYLDEKTIKKYNNLMIEHDKELFNSFRKSKIKYKKIYTNDDVVKQLQILVKR